MQRRKCLKRKHICYGHSRLKSTVIYCSKPFEDDTLSEMVRDTERKKIRTGRSSLRVVKQIVLLNDACDVTARGATQPMSHMFKNVAQQPKFLLSCDGMNDINGQHSIITLRVQLGAHTLAVTSSSPTALKILSKKGIHDWYWKSGI